MLDQTIENTLVCTVFLTERMYVTSREISFKKFSKTGGDYLRAAVIRVMADNQKAYTQRAINS